MIRLLYIASISVFLLGTNGFIACGSSDTVVFRASATDVAIVRDSCAAFPMSLTNAENVADLKVDTFGEEEKNRNHFDERIGFEGAIRYLVLHYTVCDTQDTLRIFTDDIPGGRASAHYVVTERTDTVPGGVIIQVVPEEKRAWHAGVSQWGSQLNLNATSIGIENVNSGFTDEGGVRTWYGFDEKQILAVINLCQDIAARHGILPHNIIGHSDIAVGRKFDPGIMFPWGLLHDHGVGAWLTLDERTVDNIHILYSPKQTFPENLSAVERQLCFLSLAREYGYEVPEDASIKAVLTHESIIDDDKRVAVKAAIDNVIIAFKAHFSKNLRLECYNADLDEEDVFWAWALVVKYVENEGSRGCKDEVM